MPPEIRVGDVIRIFDGTTNPPKPKRFLCVCVAEGWFLRINTRSIWRPHFLLPHVGNENCLDHDSYLELRGIIEYDDYSLEEALSQGDNHLGPISKATMIAIVAYLPSLRNLTKAECDRMIANLTAAL